MKEIVNDLDRWRAKGTRVALARVVDIEGSGPRLPGAAMAVAEDGGGPSQTCSPRPYGEPNLHGAPRKLPKSHCGISLLQGACQERHQALADHRRPTRSLRSSPH